jgi:GT2 family glycosyltransferase
MDVSIVLVSYNTREMTKNCIESVYEKTTGLSFDIWIVDNDSKDDSVKMIRQEFPEVKLIESKENLGFGRANNLAMRQIDSKYIFLLNTDTLLLNNAIKILFDFMEDPANKDVGACGGQLFNADMTLQGSTGDFDRLDWLFKKAFGLNWMSRFNRYKYKLKTNLDKSIQLSKLSTERDVDFVIGADMFLRKEAINRSGLFDERFFMFAEEAELQFRIKKNGYRIIFNPNAEILHYGGGSVKNTNKRLQTEKLYLNSNLLFYELCYGKKAAKTAKMLYMVYYFRYLFLRPFSLNSYKRLGMILEARV